MVPTSVALIDVHGLVLNAGPVVRKSWPAYEPSDWRSPPDITSHIGAPVSS